MVFKKFFVLTLCCIIGQTDRILVVVPTPSISHQVVFRPLTQELARRGHEVVVITADPAFPKGQTPENLTEIDVHDISYKILREGFLAAATRGKSNDILEQVKVLQEMMTDVFEMQIMTDEVQRLVANETNFDLLIIEAWVRPAIALAHVFKAPVILVSSFGGYGSNYDVVGAPSRPTLLYPTILRQRLFNLTLWEKLNELYHDYYIERTFDRQKEVDDRVARKLFGPDTPSTTELANKVDMLFLNVHPIWEFNRPMPPNIIFMGGLHQHPVKQLPNDLKSYLDTSKHGVIYISFGTNVSPSQLPPERIQVLVRTLSLLPYDVIWKWDKDELPGRSDNIRISKWLPQSDLLKHPNVKLFITQGGLQSTDEAISAGVPLIGMPMLGDQWYNVEQYVYHKIGLRLNMETLTDDILKTAIDTIVKDDSYRKNVIKLRTIMTDQPQNPLDRAVWWTEHVMRHGGAPHLRARVANMSWTEYLDLELLMFLFVCAFVVVIVNSIAAYLLFTFIMSVLLSGKKIKSN